jgi:diadenylate cyclase
VEYIHNIIQQLGQGKWSDYLDILLVTVLVYYVLQLVRSAAAARIGKVVLLILVAAWLTEELELHTLNFLISQVATVGLIALVVLF